MANDLTQFIAACREFMRGMEYKSESADFRYSMILPGASYSPWMTDAAFLAAHEVLKAHTMVDIYRCYELWTLVEQTGQLGGDILEVGVWQGGTGCLMAVKARLSGFKSRVYLADTFTGVVKAGDMDAAYRGGEHADRKSVV